MQDQKTVIFNLVEEVKKEHNTNLDLFDEYTKRKEKITELLRQIDDLIKSDKNLTEREVLNINWSLEKTKGEHRLGGRIFYE